MSVIAHNDDQNQGREEGGMVEYAFEVPKDCHASMRVQHSPRGSVTTFEAEGRTFRVAQQNAAPPDSAA
ncbi:MULTISPECIES: hypothetical protein [unclassified Streptomyces]|nr:MULTISPECIES: hypothetical protein [unclassified Streptomyces]WEH29500.1 hypothetical protein P0D76_20460 [Streptomyces sp. AM 3-1-1]SCD37915.1 hypothetical protein GA0115246_1010012 [Streptomyces sp. SolWspMP-sol7th]